MKRKNVYVALMFSLLIQLKVAQTFLHPEAQHEELD